MNRLKKFLYQGNAKVLIEQAKDFYWYANADLEKAKVFWKTGRRGKAIHTYLFGPLGEAYQHMWRWVMYRDIILIGVALWALVVNK